MTRVSTDLDPQTWGALDRYAECHGMTRSQAVEHAVKELVGDFEAGIHGLTQMGVAHPFLDGTGSEQQP